MTLAPVQMKWIFGFCRAKAGRRLEAPLPSQNPQNYNGVKSLRAQRAMPVPPYREEAITICGRKLR
jgi:hypothetical protein